MCSRDNSISIHSARVGGDIIDICAYSKIDISIHSARVGGDILNSAKETLNELFQSTPPVWAETLVQETD